MLGSYRMLQICTKYLRENRVSTKPKRHSSSLQVSPSEHANLHTTSSLSSLSTWLVRTQPFPCAHVVGNRQCIRRQAPSLAELTCYDSPLWCDHSHVQTQPKERTGLCPLMALMWLVKRFLQQTQLLAAAALSLRSSAPCWIQWAVPVWCQKYSHH